MADKIFFKTGSASSLPTTKTAGQLLFAIDGTTGSIYLDKDSKTRIKFNADAVKLATPRSINGTTFDGSTDITTANWGTARNISISDATGANTGTAVSVNGSQAVTLKLPATLVATLKGNADSATKATSADKATVSESCTGNAATATKLKSGVSINGSTFDGSAGITTAKWGTARIITVSDNTGDYTQTNSGIDGSANFTLKLPATITATLIGNADSATYATTAGTANSAKACTGNAATATKLKAGVAINGTTFDGSTAITTTKWGTARNISIGNSDGTGAGTAVSVDGSGAVTLKLPSEIKANVTSAGKLSGDSSDVGDANTPVYFEDGIPKPITSIDVKSDKAGKLDPGATINGTLFTGESNITTTTWGTARNVTIKDASKTNTGAAVSVNGSDAFSLLLPATIKATLDGNAATATKATTADSATTATTCTGNAATATKLKTGASINGTSFDGSTGITTTKWGTARTVTISDNTGTYTQTNTGIDGGANFTLKLPATLAASITGNAATATKATSADSATTATTCTGNAGTATALKNARSINGTSFNGTGDITTANWGTARTVTISDNDGTNTQANTGINGSANFTLKLPATIKANLTGKATSAGTADSATTATTATTCTGNAATATILQTARSINGTSFNGSTDITTTKWGTARNFTIKDADSTNSGTAVSVDGSGAVTLKLPSTIKANITGKATSAGTADSATTATTATTCTGNAATATKLKSGVAINGTTFDGSSAITTANWGTSRNITIKDGSGNKGTAVSVNGGSNVELILPTTIAATVSAADKLTVNAGDSSTPVYFEGGVPKAVTSIDVKSDKAAKLDPGKNINGTLFTGESDITTTTWGTARTLTIGNTGKSVNGSGNVSWTLAEIGASDTKLLKNNCVSFTVDGDANSYYPVLIDSGHGSLFGWEIVSISRSYSAAAPDTWNNATHKGALTLTLRWSGDTGWGGNDKTIVVEEFNEQYSTMVGGLELSVNGLIVWLRGGGAIYNLTTPYGKAATASVKLTDYTASDKKVYSARTYNADTVNTEVKGKWYLRSNKFYGSASKLMTARTINGTSFDGSGNITTSYWGTERTISISSVAGTTGTKINGNADKSLVIPSTMTGFASITSTTFVGDLSGKATSAGTADSATTASSCTGNAATATKLATPRNITISGTASSSIGTFDGNTNTTIYMPLTIQGFNEIKTKKLTITSTEQVSHLAFSRGGWNYFTAPTSGSFAFAPGGREASGTGATLTISTTEVIPGNNNNTINLGSSSYKWKNVYATTFTGALSGNATTATTLATPRNLTISDTASSSVASFNGGSNTTLYMPLAIKGFTSIESDKFVVNDKVTLQYNTTNECLEFVFA